MKSAKLLIAAGIAVGLGLATPVQAADPVKVAFIADSTGPFEAYAKQTAIGFHLGLEYYTHGTMEVAGRKIVVIEKDSQFKPDVGRNVLSEAFGDDNADFAVGGSSSAVALAMLPVAEEFKKVLIVEPAVADSITGDKWNRYIFRTARNSSQDAIANAKAIGKPDEVYAPPTTTDFTAPAQRIFDALDKEQGRKILYVVWAGGNPYAALKSLAPEKHNIEIATGGNILPALVAYKAFPGMEGATYYYYDIPKNPANTWLVAEHTKRFNSPPDFFTAGGFSAAGAVVATLTKTGGKTDTETLIKAMEGMSFDTPKGTMTFRASDHQAMQSMYGFKVKVDPAVAWAVLEPTKEITAAEMDVPVMNKR